MEISPAQLDNEAYTSWHETLNTATRKPFYHYSTMKNPKTLKRRFHASRMPTPKTEMDWLLHTVLNSNSRLLTECLMGNSTDILHHTWATLSDPAKTKFTHLAIIHHKYCQSILIEHFVQSKGFSIGHVESSFDIEIQLRNPSREPPLISDRLLHNIRLLLAELIEYFTQHT